MKMLSLSSIPPASDSRKGEEVVKAETVGHSSSAGFPQSRESHTGAVLRSSPEISLGRKNRSAKHLHIIVRHRATS